MGTKGTHLVCTIRFTMRILPRWADVPSGFLICSRMQRSSSCMRQKNRLLNDDCVTSRDYVTSFETEKGSAALSVNRVSKDQDLLEACTTDLFQDGNSQLNHAALLGGICLVGVRSRNLLDMKRSEDYVVDMIRRAPSSLSKHGRKVYLHE